MTSGYLLKRLRDIGEARRDRERDAAAVAAARLRNAQRAAQNGFRAIAPAETREPSHTIGPDESVAPAAHAREPFLPRQELIARGTPADSLGPCPACGRVACRGYC